jgi:hypothetical protein
MRLVKAATAQTHECWLVNEIGSSIRVHHTFRRKIVLVTDKDDTDQRHGLVVRPECSGVTVKDPRSSATLAVGVLKRRSLECGLFMQEVTTP